MWSEFSALGLYQAEEEMRKRWKKQYVQNADVRSRERKQRVNDEIFFAITTLSLD